MSKITYEIDVDDQASRPLDRITSALKRQRDALLGTTKGSKRLRDEQGRFVKRAKGLSGAMGSLQTAGLAYAAVLGTVAVATATVVRHSAELEQSVQNAVAVTGGSYETLERAAVSAGMASAFSAREAGEALEFLGMAGLSATQATEALPGVLSLAAAGSLDLARAADITSNVMSGFRLNTEDLSHVNDVLAATATSANVSVDQLGTTMAYVAPIMQASGQSLESAAAAAGILGDAGIQGSMAGTTLRGAIVRLQKPSRKSEAALKALGVSVLDTNGNMRDFADILEDLNSAGASNQDFATLFGQEALAGVLALSKSLPELRAETARLTSEIDGAARATERDKLDALEAQAKITAGALETLSGTIGGTFRPQLKESLKTVNAYLASKKLLSEQIQTLTGFVERNEEVWHALTVGGLATAVGMLEEGADAVQTMGTVLGPVADASIWVGQALGVLGDSGNSARDIAVSLANGVEWLGRGFSTLLTIVFPLAGVISHIALSFVDLEGAAGDAAEAIERLDAERRIKELKEDADAFYASVARLGPALLNGAKAYGVALVDQIQQKEAERKATENASRLDAKYWNLKRSALSQESEIRKVQLELRADLLKLSQEEGTAQELSYKRAKLRADAEAKILELKKAQAQAEKEALKASRDALTAALGKADAAQTEAHALTVRAGLATRELGILREQDALKKLALEKEAKLYEISQNRSLLEEERKAQIYAAELEHKQAVEELEKRRLERIEKENKALLDTITEDMDSAIEANFERRQSQLLNAAGVFRNSVGELDSALQAFADLEALQRTKDELKGLRDDLSEAATQAERLQKLKEIEAGPGIAEATRGLLGLGSALLETTAATNQLAKDGASSSAIFASAVGGLGPAFAEAAGELGASRRQMSGILAAFYAAEAVGLGASGNVPGAIAAGTAAAMHGAIAGGVIGGGAGASSAGAPGSAGSASTSTRESSRSFDSDEFARRQARYLADALNDNQGGGVTINFDFSGSNGVDSPEFQDAITTSVMRGLGSQGIDLRRLMR